MPAHSFKYTAALQKAQQGDAPVLIPRGDARGPRRGHADEDAHRCRRGQVDVPLPHTGHGQVEPQAAGCKHLKPETVPPKPSVKAILICDQVIHEYGTNKKSLIGIFEEIHLPKFPARYPRIAAYVNLTDAHGEYEMELRLLTEKGEEIGRGKTPKVKIDNPLATCEFALQIQNIQFPAAGQFEFQILANGEYLGSKTFRVKAVN